MTSVVLSDREPRRLWAHFDHILKIPRPSGQEDRIAEYIKQFASHHNYEIREDSVGNLVLAVPPTAGKEKLPITILQGHLDMVCEKNEEVEHDFLRDPIRVRQEEDWLKAQGTTLGADNGIGLAAAMAIAEDPDVAHGPLELLFTRDEERGLVGAAQLDPALLTGKRMLNLDSEDDETITIGCAGGADVRALLPLERTSSTNGKGFLLRLRGLLGGHSGLDIDRRRGNAIKLLARALLALVRQDLPFELVSFQGGSKHNAIPREASAHLRLPPQEEEHLQQLLHHQEELYRQQFGSSEPSLSLELQSAEVLDPAWTSSSRDRLLLALNGLAHGVMAMNEEIKGLVETSNNLAVVRTLDKGLDFWLSVRSAVDSALEAAREQLRSVLELAGATVTLPVGYPGWRPNLDSPLLQTAQEVFQRLHQKEPRLEAIHAGLECGLIGEKIPGMDMISIGPNIRDPHSPDEALSFSSTQRFWDLVVSLLLQKNQR